VFHVVISTVSTGRVQRRQFDYRSAAEKWARRIEALALRSRIGLRSVRVELYRVAA
jgi:hypothetical protein